MSQIVFAFYQLSCELRSISLISFESACDIEAIVVGTCVGGWDLSDSNVSSSYSYLLYLLVRKLLLVARATFQNLSVLNTAFKYLQSCIVMNAPNQTPFITMFAFRNLFSSTSLLSLLMMFCFTSAKPWEVDIIKYVSPSGNDIPGGGNTPDTAYRTLLFAIEDSAPLVLADDYTLDLRMANGSYPSAGNADLSVDFSIKLWPHPANDSATAEFDLTGANSFMTVTNAERFTMEQLIIRNAGSSALQITGVASVRIVSCLFQGNGHNNSDHLLVQGGGIYVDTSNIILTSVSFINNTAFEGGGVYVTSGSDFELTYTLTATGCHFASNTATTDGGGMYISNSFPTLLRNIFHSNNATTGSGGAVFMNAISENSAIFIVQLEGVNNYAGKDGGCLAVRNAALLFQSSATSLTHNHAVGDGGAICAENGDMQVDYTSLALAENDAGGVGGAIALVNSADSFSNRMIFYSRNKARHGADVYLSRSRFDNSLSTFEFSANNYSSVYIGRGSSYSCATLSNSSVSVTSRVEVDSLGVLELLVVEPIDFCNSAPTDRFGQVGDSKRDSDTEFKDEQLRSSGLVASSILNPLPHASLYELTSTTAMFRDMVIYNGALVEMSANFSFTGTIMFGTGAIEWIVKDHNPSAVGFILVETALHVADYPSPELVAGIIKDIGDRTLYLRRINDEIVHQIVQMHLLLISQSVGTIHDNQILEVTNGGYIELEGKLVMEANTTISCAAFHHTGVLEAMPNCIIKTPHFFTSLPCGEIHLHMTNATENPSLPVLAMDFSTVCFGGNLSVFLNVPLQGDGHIYNLISYQTAPISDSCKFRTTELFDIEGSLVEDAVFEYGENMLIAHVGESRGETEGWVDWKVVVEMGFGGVVLVLGIVWVVYYVRVYRAAYPDEYFVNPVERVCAGGNSLSRRRCNVTKLTIILV